MSTAATSLPPTRGNRRGRPPSGLKKVILTISLQQATYDELVAHARETGDFKGHVIDRALIHYLARLHE
jgi:hypothetical protein